MPCFGVNIDIRAGLRCKTLFFILAHHFSLGGSLKVSCLESSFLSSKKDSFDRTIRIIFWKGKQLFYCLKTFICKVTIFLHFFNINRGYYFTTFLSHSFEKHRFIFSYFSTQKYKNKCRMQLVEVSSAKLYRIRKWAGFCKTNSYALYVNPVYFLRQKHSIASYQLLRCPNYFNKKCPDQGRKPRKKLIHFLSHFWKR